MGLRKLVFVASLLTVLGAESARAQVITGSIIGSVKDESSAILPGVTITLTSPALPSGPLVVVTNEKGEYRFTQLAPGRYSLATSLTGFSTYNEDGLEVSVNSTVERNITLKVGAVSETVTVSGETPMVDTRRVGVSSNMKTETLDTLPIHRYQAAEFAKWSPGVAPTDPGGSGAGLSVMGSATSENSVLVDGINILTPNGGNWGSGDLDTFEEVQVVTIAASAEYQVAQGGILNIVMKQGTNKMRLDASGYWYPDKLISKPIMLNCNCPLGQTGFTTLFWRNYSGHVGGPIKKDKLWFYTGGNYDAKIITTPGIDPNRARRDHPFYSHAGMGKVTWQATRRIRFAQVYNADWWGGQIIPTVSRPFETQSPQFGLVRSYSSELTATVSNNTLLTVRATGILDPEYPQRPFTGDTTTPIRNDSVTGISCCGVASFGRLDLWRHGQAVKVSRVITAAHADHNLAMGVQFEEAGTDSFMALPSGINYSFSNGQPNQATLRAPFAEGASYHSGGVWAEDQMTFGGRLTVSVGARFDRMQAISQDLPAIDNQLNETGQTIAGLGDMFTWKVFAPRVGFNLKLTEDAKTVVRGSYGRAYRPVFTGDFSNVHPGVSPSTLARFDPATGGYTTIISVTDPKANLRVDPNVKAPYTDSYAFGFDRELATNLGFSASFVHKDGKNQIGWTDIAGVYGQQTVALSNGQSLVVKPILNATSARIFLRTNPEGFYSRYNGLLLSVNKRFSQRWQANISYTRSKAEGLTGGSGGNGQDPNDYINAAGLLATDRPNLFTFTGGYQVPRVDVLVSGSFMSAQGAPYAPQAQITLPQGSRAINIAAPDGTYRFPTQNLLGMRISKNLFRHGSSRLEVAAEAMNLLQSKAFDSVTSRIFNASTFGTASNWIEPRRMNLLVRLNY